MLKKILTYFEDRNLTVLFRPIRRQLEGQAEVIIKWAGEKAVQGSDFLEWVQEGLVITDSAAAAGKCRCQNVPVVLYLYQGNRDADFCDIPYAIESLEAVSYQYLQGVYDRCHKVPWTILETQRCVVREMTEADTGSIYSLYTGKHASRYLEKLPACQETYQTYILDYAAYVYGFYEYGMWVVVEKCSGNVIGRAGVEWKTEIEGAELGYVIKDTHQECGYAYEVCTAIVDYAEKELGFTTLFTVIEKGNIPSEGLARKLGFIQDREVERQIKDKKIKCNIYKYSCRTEQISVE